MTTLLIDDELSRMIGQVAEAQGKTLDEFVHEVLKHAVNAAVISRTVRTGLPVMQVNPPVPIGSRAVQRMLAEQGF